MALWGGGEILETLNQTETSVGNQDKGSLVTLPITYENISLEHAKSIRIIACLELFKLTPFVFQQQKA